MVKIQTELEYHGYSPCLQELTHSLESVFELSCRPKRASPLRTGVVVKNRQKKKTKQRELLYRDLQIPLNSLLASSNPCTKSTHLAKIWSEAEGMPVKKWASSWQSQIWKGHCGRSSQGEQISHLYLRCRGNHTATYSHVQQLKQHLGLLLPGRSAA